MSNKRPKRISSSDRSMEPVAEDRSEVFFFPKHVPPVSIRAASQEEAQDALMEQDQERLQSTNPQEHD